MRELAGLGDQLVARRIGRVFADGVQLRPVFGDVQVQDGLAVRRPIGRSDAPGRQLEPAVLFPVGIHQPQRLVGLPVEDLRAPGPRDGVAHLDRRLQHRALRAVGERHRAEPPACAAPLREGGVGSVRRYAHSRTPVPTLRDLVQLALPHGGEVGDMQGASREVAERAVIRQKRDGRAVQFRGPGQLARLAALQIHVEGLGRSAAVAAKQHPPAGPGDGAVVIRRHGAGISRVGEAVDLHLRGRIGVPPPVRWKRGSLESLGGQAGPGQSGNEKRSARESARRGGHMPMVSYAQMACQRVGQIVNLDSAGIKPAWSSE